MVEANRPGRQAGCDARLIDRLLAVIEDEIVPLTEKEVMKGNKIFGAAILRKDDLSTVMVGSNNESENPLWHGEVQTIKLFYEIDREERPAPGDLIFLSTHEPCPLCLSAIAWAGFDNFYYLFSHQDSRDSFSIGHDLKILKEIFNRGPGEYRRKNYYWTGYGIRDLIGNCPEATRKKFRERVERITEIYGRLSEIYQGEKDRIDPRDIPFK